MIRNLIKFFLLVSLLGCSEEDKVLVASFESLDSAAKVSVILNKIGFHNEIVENKSNLSIYVDRKDEHSARELVTKFNYYFEETDVGELLESKFSSLSKLEEMKGNLVITHLLENQVGSFPKVLKAKAIVNGRNEKIVSLMILLSEDLTDTETKSIEKFLAGSFDTDDKLTITYITLT